MSSNNNSKIPNFIDFGIEEEVDPKVKFNSLLSVTISTIMCLASKCPLPKSNIDTTKLFLSTITDDNGHTPRNIEGFLELLNNYTGPYDNDSHKETRFEKPPSEKPPREKEKPSMEECKTTSNASNMIVPKEGHGTDSQLVVKKASRIGVRRGEKDSKKIPKSTNSRVSPSKLTIA